MLRVTNLKRWLVFWGGLLLLGLWGPAAAHNGAMAIAVPVEGIKIDGDLSDWPAGMRRYSIPLAELGVPPRNPQDFQGTFRIGYSPTENVLYLAIEVEDESTIVSTVPKQDFYQDGCEIYLGLQHSLEKDTQVLQYRLWGNHLSEADESGRPTSWAGHVAWAQKRSGGTHRYEWKIDIGGASKDGVRFRPGMVLGLGMVVLDNDKDDSFSWMSWGRGIDKWIASRRGDVVLVGNEDGLGRLRGRVKWEDVKEGIVLGKVRIQSLTNPDLWVQVQTDSQGVYEAELPIGKYQAEAGYRCQKTATEVEVRKGGTTTVPEVFFPRPPLGVITEAGKGTVVKAGPGRKVKAGNGTWRSVWQSFGTFDGLVSSSIQHMCQDRQGDLWFAGVGPSGVSRFDGRFFTTFSARDGLPDHDFSYVRQDFEGHLWFGTWGGGVSRYDGQNFTTLTTADGLASDFVHCVLEDRNGDLWFGTGGVITSTDQWVEGGGVSRYDGKHFTTFTTEDGLAGNSVVAITQDRSGNLWFGTDLGVSRYDGHRFVNFSTQDGLAGTPVLSIQEDKAGTLWFGTYGGGVSRFDGENWRTFNQKNGLSNNIVLSILEDSKGHLWFASWGGGVDRYDGERFINLSVKDGLAHFEVPCVMEDNEGNLWFGTSGGGVSRYGGEYVTSFSKKDGLASEWLNSLFEDRKGRIYLSYQEGEGVDRFDGNAFTHVPSGANCILEDRAGNLWFSGTGGFGRYDGTTFRAFTTADGLVNGLVHKAVQDRIGDIWFGTAGGVSRYDGKRFTNYTTENGLASDEVFAILEDREGRLWFCSRGAVSRYDRQSWSTFAEKDGFGPAPIITGFQDSRGDIWFGTDGSGVTRYAGGKLTTFTTADGMVGNVVGRILEDRDGNLWFGSTLGMSRFDGQRMIPFTDAFGQCWLSGLTKGFDGHLWIGTFGAGVVRYDGRVFQHLTRQDGLPTNTTVDLLQARNGDTWIASEGGVARYRTRHSPPGICVDDVVTDQRHGPVERVDLPGTQKYLAFEFHGRSFKTIPGNIVYLYRLEEVDTDWQQTREERVEYLNLPTGEYSFQVKAVDRDLDYSETPATVKVTIHPPYGQIALVGGLGLSLMGLVIASGYGIKRRRERDRSREELVREQQQRLLAQEALNKELEEELQTAHTLQMDLMPRESPQIPGFDLAGRCIPANHVGGDLFQYFHQDGKLSIALADVTGHAMEAAIPMVMFSGVLKSQIEISSPIEELFGRLNRSLHNAAGSRTFVCFAFGTIDTGTSTLRLSSAAFPYPYHFCAATGEIAELQVDAYPLGVRPDTTYQAIERELAPGDYLVFCSDGIIEATDQTGAQFGYERTAASLRSGCAAGLSAEALLERVVVEVRAFRGETPQGDDQTVVVLKVAA